MEITQLKINSEKSADGVWVDLDETTKILVARIGNPKYNKVFTSLSARDKQMIAANTLSDTTASKIMNENIANNIILDWVGLTNDGKKWPCTLENKMEILTNEDYIQLREIIMTSANNFELFRADVQKEDEKKS